MGEMKLEDSQAENGEDGSNQQSGQEEIRKSS